MIDQDFAYDDRFRIILCGSSHYDRKYYYNHQFDQLPQNIKEELNIMCVLFTEEVGGVFTIGYTPTGEVMMDSRSDEGDLLYDEISAGLMMKEIRRKKQELFQSLSAYYKIKFLHMNPADVLVEDDDESATASDAEERRYEDSPYRKSSVPEDM